MPGVVVDEPAEPALGVVLDARVLAQGVQQAAKIDVRQLVKGAVRGKGLGGWGGLYDTGRLPEGASRVGEVRHLRADADDRPRDQPQRDAAQPFRHGAPGPVRTQGRQDAEAAGGELADEGRDPRRSELAVQPGLQLASLGTRAQVDEDRQVAAALRGQAQRGAAGAGVLGGVVALLGQLSQGGAVGRVFPGRGVDEPGDGQGHRGPLQDGDVLRPEGRAVGGGPEHGQAAPAFALVGDGRREPALRAARLGVVTGLGGPGALFPVAERLLHRAPRRFADQRLMHQVLQDDRAAAHLRRRAHHVLGSRAAQRQRGERLVDPLGPAHRVGLAAEDEGVDDLRDLQEVDVPREGDQGQTPGAAGLDEGVGRPVVPPYQFDDQGGSADLGEFVDVPADTRGVVGQGHARGQDQLAALEEGRRVRQLGDVHPAHRPVQLGQSGDDLGLPGGQDGQGQDIGDARRVWVHGGSLHAWSL